MDNHAPTLVLADLESRLAAIRGAIRRTAVTHGVAILCIALCVVLGVSFWLDATWRLPTAVRVGLLVVSLLVAAGAIAMKVVRPLVRRMSDPELAAVVEISHPELQERLLSSLELARLERSDPSGGSPLMREWLFRQTAKTADSVSFVDVVDSRPAFKYSLLAAVSIIAIVAPFAIWRDGYGNLWARFFNPLGNYARGANLSFDVLPGDLTIPRGEDVTITAKPQFRRGENQRPSSATLTWTNDNGEADERTLRWDDEKDGFVAVMPQVLQGFRYQIEADGGASREFHVRVVERPAITALTLDVQPPAYCGRPAERVDGAVGELRVFERSALTFQMVFNKPVKEARWLWVEEVRRKYDGKPRGKGTSNLQSTALAGIPFTLDDTIPLQLDQDRKSASWKMVADREGSFEIILLDEYGIQNRIEPARTLRLIRDEAPTIAWTDGGDHPQAKTDDVLSFGVAASDDIGLAAVELHYAVLPTRAGEQVIEADSALLGGREFSTSFPIDLRKLLLPVGSLVSVKARAVDEREVPGPNEAWTSERIIAITKDAQPYGAAQLAERQQHIRDALRALRKEAVEREKEVGDLKQKRQDVVAKGEAFDLKKPGEELIPSQELLAEKIEQLAAELSDDGLMAHLTQPLEDVAAKDVRPAVEQMQQATDAAADQQPQKLDQAQAELREADQHLGQVEQKFEELAKLETDLLELNRLADRTDRLANDVADFEQKQNRLASEPEDSPQREEVEEDRKDLRQEQQQLTQNLQDLLNRRPELTEAARAGLLEKLQELADRANQIADKEDQLAEAMRAAAQENAEGLSEDAEKQRELVEQAERLAAETELEQGRQAVPLLDLDALQKALRDLQNGNAEDAIAAQKEAAADLEKLAEAFARNQQLSSDPREAARELMRREEAVRNQLQQAAQQAQQSQQRQGFDPEARSQELQKELKDAAIEQAAIQAAAAQLDVPQNNEWRQKEAVNQANEALRNLLANAPQQASESANRARENLEALANEVGSPEERRQRALDEARNLRNMQAGLANHLDNLRNQNSTGQQSADQLAPQLEQQIPQQTEIARRAADLEQSQADEEQWQAVQDAAKTLTSLQARNPQDAAAAAQQAEESLAELVRKLEGKPSTTEDAEQLVKEQEELGKAAKQALDSGKPDDISPRIDDQRKQAEALKQFDPAGNRQVADTAIRAAEEAANYLDVVKNNPQQRPQADAAMARAQEAVEQLAKSMQSPLAGNEERARELAKQQSQSAEDARQQAANAKTPLAPNAASQADRQAAAARELSSIPSSSAQAEKRDAAQALQQAREAQERVEQLARNQQPQNPAVPANANPELADAQQKNAAAQQAAADALSRFAEKLGQPGAAEANANSDQQSLANAAAAREPGISELEQLAQKAEQLANMQKEAREKTQPLADGIADQVQHNNQLNQARDAQNKVNGEMGQLSRSAAPEARAEAQQRSQFASDALGWDKPQRAVREQQAAEDALRELSKQARNQAAALAAAARQDSSAPPNSKPAEGQAQSGQAKAAAMSDRAQQLAEAQRQLAESLANSSKSQPANNQQPAAGQPPGEQQAGAAQRARDAVAQQQEIAEGAAQLAVNAAAAAPESPAAEQARQFAEQAAAAADKANTGNFQKSQEQGAQAAVSGSDASKQLEENPVAQGGPQPELSEDARQLAQSQQQVSEQMQQLAKTPEARNAAQSQGQKRLEQDTRQLESELQKLAQQLKAQPVDRNQQSEQASKACNCSNGAAQSMSLAAKQSKKGNSAAAAQSAKQAADELRKSASQAKGQPSGEQKSPNNPVPNEVGGQVTDAQRQLREAGEMLAKGPPKPGKGKGEQGQSQTAQNGKEPGQNGEKGEGQQPGQSPGDTPGGEGQEGESELADAGQEGGEGAEGQMSQSGQPSQGQGAQSAAQSLRQGAQALRQAASDLQLRPGEGDQQMAGQPGQPGKPGGKNGQKSQNRGANETPRIVDLDTHLKALSTRNWGELPGTLRTEILQSSRKRPDGDYARLIKLYFDEISRGQPSESVPEEQAN